ncbi:hypothetical protein CIB48_g7058 [Xylaria polymorpha]|nr:hypothetical protein CIB48_g7058 [Xylaria polymorpha]
MQQSCRLERLTYYSVVGFKLRTCQQDTPGTFDEIKGLASGPFAHRYTDTPINRSAWAFTAQQHPICGYLQKIDYSAYTRVPKEAGRHCQKSSYDAFISDAIEVRREANGEVLLPNEARRGVIDMQYWRRRWEAAAHKPLKARLTSPATPAILDVGLSASQGCGDEYGAVTAVGLGNLLT